MKKSLLFSAVLAGLMLGSCSSSDDIAGNNTGFNETGKGYINISLNLPTQGKNVSRAANDVTADGVADEYKVNDAALLLFAGANENNAVFQGAYNLDGLKKTDIDANVQISTQLTKVQEISSVSATGNIYAFVLVNKGSNIVVNTDHTITVNRTPFTGKFSDFSQLKVDGAFVNDNLMMTNVPVVTKPGSTAAFDDATVLADVTKSIFKTEAEAKANPAADVFVERVASKVTLGMTGTGTSTETLSADGATAEKFKYTLEGWNLANVNKSSYLVRQYDNSWNSLASNGHDFLTGADKSAFDANPYRFAGINLIKTKVSSDPAANKYRTYWGKDINYDTNAPFASDPTVGDANLTLGNNATTYCYENTFDVDHQNVCNTTTAIVKMKITPDSYTGTGGTFYIINGGKDVVYSLANAKTKVGNQFLAENTESSLKTKYFSEISEAGKISVSNVEFSDKAGAVTFTKLVLTFTPDAGGSATTKEETNPTVLAALANNIKVVEYKGGYSYYNILIKHFGDELTPWNPSTKTSGISYPTPNEANWLGRYGVLRNNWYDLDITGVSRLGAATPEELDVKKDPTPDDNLKSYISVKINVLSWAKRTQKAILGQ